MTPRFAVDSRAIRPLRAVLSLLVLVDLAMRAPWLREHYTDAGMLPRAQAMPEGVPAAVTWASPYFWSGSEGWVATLFAVTAVACLVSMVSQRPRRALGLVFWLMLSLGSRNLLLFHGGDRLLSWLLLCAIALPDPPANKPTLVTGPAAVATWLQMSWVLLSAGVHKLLSPQWQSGEALGLILSETHNLGPLGGLAASLPGLQYATWAVIAGQLGMPLLWIGSRRPNVRGVALGCCAVFGTTVTLILDAGLFGPALVAGLMPLVPQVWWDRFTVRRSSIGSNETDRANGGRPVTAWLTLGAVTTTLALSLVSSPLRSTVGRLQSWRMFAASDGAARSYEILWRPRGGDAVDVMPVRWRQPLRWRLALRGLAVEPAWRHAHPAFAAFLCRERARLGSRGQSEGTIRLNLVRRWPPVRSQRHAVGQSVRRTLLVTRCEPSYRDKPSSI